MFYILLFAVYTFVDLKAISESTEVISSCSLKFIHSS